MLNLAVCDDEVTVLEVISSVLRRQFEKLGLKTNITCFHLGMELWKAFCSGTSFDVFFIDIDMKDIDGIALAKRLRERNCKAIIVFISGREEYVFKSFTVQPFRFVRKSEFKNEIMQLVEDIVKETKREADHNIVLDTRGSSVRLNPFEIIFVECNNKTLHIETEHKNLQLEFRLSEIEKMLEKYGFIKTHKSYLVNYRYIFSIEKTDIVLDTGGRVPISKHRITEVKKEFRSLTI